MPEISYSPATPSDFEDLAAIRLEAMRDSLERVGRFDPVRARQRLLDSFRPGDTRLIFIVQSLCGFYALRTTDTEFVLDHLYIRTAYQKSGIGSKVIRDILSMSQIENKPVRVCALRESPANGFYLEHNFVYDSESEWDIYYVWNPA